MGIFDKKRPSASKRTKSLFELAQEAQEQENQSVETNEITDEETVCAYRIAFDKSGEQGIFDSKVGGVPYVDLNNPDCVENGLCLLLQINLEKQPLGENLNCGMLQFFIGADITANCDFRVVYHSSIDYNITAEDVQKLGINCLFCNSAPLVDCASFSLEAIDDSTENSDGHKFFGYPFFCQDDVRELWENGKKYDALLLQLTTDLGENPVFKWGDSGTAHFFINSKRLSALDFSDVKFSWETY